MKKPSDWHHPRCSGLRVQGTAISPAAHCLVYGISEGMSRNFYVEDGRKQRAALWGRTLLPDIDEREVGRVRIALGLYNYSTDFLRYFKECYKKICELKCW